MSKLARVAVVVLGCCVGLGGCTGVEPAIIGAAFTGAQAGVTVSRLGKLQVAERATGLQVVEATLASAAELGLTVRKRELEDHNRWEILLVDNRKAIIEVDIDQRSPRLTWFQVDVGVLGNKPMAQLVLKRVLHHLGVMEPPGGEGGVDAGAVPSVGGAAGD